MPVHKIELVVTLTVSDRTGHPYSAAVDVMDRLALLLDTACGRDNVFLGIQG